MSINFPTSLDSLSNPSGGDAVGVVSHSTQHANANDAIEALEAKVGVDNSAVTTSLDYKIKSTSSIDPGHKHTEGSITLADVTTDDVSSTKHGFAPKSPADATKFLNGAANPAYAEVKDSDLSLSDITTNDVSTTKHGFVPKAPNDTTKFLRGDGTWASSSTSVAATTLVPEPNFYFKGDGQDINLTGNTTAHVGQVIVPFSITANKISFYVRVVTVAGTAKVALFSQDGATKLFEVTTATISGAGIVTTSLSAATAIAAGVYYIMILPVSTTNINPTTYVEEGVGAAAALRSVSSKAVIQGTITVTASTVPSTITPTSITSSDSNTLVHRLDN